MQAQQRSPPDPNLLRVLVVGETKVGKTLLIRRLCHQVFAFSSAVVAAANGHGKSTEGAAQECDTTEEDFYFAAQWGPTIGFEMDCLVRDAYGVRDGHARNGTTHNHFVYPTGMPDGEMSTPLHSKTSVVSGGGDVLTRRRSSSVVSGGRRGTSPNLWPSGNGVSFRGGENGNGNGTLSPMTDPASTPHVIGTLLDVTCTANGEDVAPTSPKRSHLSQQRPTPQTVELYELGGTHTFSPDCTLPLPLMDFDGIMFVYDRANTSSTTGIHEWYTHMKRLFATRTEAEGRRPRLMLVGTQLTASSSLSAMLGNMDGRSTTGTGHERDGEDCFPSDDALMDPEVRLRTQHQLAARRKRKRNRPGFLVRKLRGGVYAWLSFFRLAVSPSLILSEQYQEERSTRGFRLFFQLLELNAALLMWAERVLLYGMAVVLFGFYQDVVKVQQPTVRAALDAIKEDRFFSAQCHVCHLYDRLAFESSLDEIVGFFDTLHREKVSPAVHGK